MNSNHKSWIFWGFVLLFGWQSFLFGKPVEKNLDLDLQNLLKSANQEAEKAPNRSESEQNVSPTRGTSNLFKKFNQFNPSLTAFLDGTYHLSDHPIMNDSGQVVSRRFSLREVEMDLRADIDPYAKGVLIVSYGQEKINEYTLNVEEGYLTLETLPFNFRAKIGVFRMDFGAINRLHSHDLPQVDYPLPVQKYLGMEGWSGQGISLSNLLPFAPMELIFQMTNGDLSGTFPYPQMTGGQVQASHLPTYIGRIKYNDQLGENMDFQLGSSIAYAYGDPKGKQENIMIGGDVFLRWKPLKNTNWSFAFQGEIFYVRRELTLGRTHGLGGYVFGQLQTFRNWYIGTRYDFADNIDTPGSNPKEYGVSNYLSYYTSEFLRFRVGYEYDHKGNNMPNIHSIVFQVTFIFGSHPSEAYWFNK